MAKLAPEMAPYLVPLIERLMMIDLTATGNREEPLLRQITGCHHGEEEYSATEIINHRCFLNAANSNSSKIMSLFFLPQA